MPSYLTEQQNRAVFSTGLILVPANLLPLLAVLKLGWTCYDLLILYWIEAILVGFLNVVRMILVTPKNATTGYHLLKLAFVPFFIGHFGLFCLAVGLALQLIFGKANLEVSNPLLILLSGGTAKLFWPLLISHLFSFFRIYIAEKEYRKSTISRRMIIPYLRVVPVQVVVILSALACLHFESLPWALPAMVGLKTMTDLIVHLKIHAESLRVLKFKGVITESMQVKKGRDDR